MGVVRPGTVSATIGTSGVVFAATDRPALDTCGRVHTFCHAVPERWHVMGVTQGAGLSLRWFKDTFGVGDPGEVVDRDPYDRLCAVAGAAPVGSDGVMWAPYLMGERTPHLDPHARAALVGLSASHSRAHISRALLEGVAFSLRDSLTIIDEMGLSTVRVRLGGGGARSPLWRQIQADVYQLPVELLEVEEGAAYGASLLAGVGAGLWDSVDQASEAVVRVAETLIPIPEHMAALDRQYERFRRLYQALHP
jgi:xylulokinase